MSDQILLFGPGGRNVARLGNFVDKRWMKFVCKRGRMRTKSVSTKMRPLTMSACVAGTLYIARASKFRFPPEEAKIVAQAASNHNEATDTI